MITGMPRSLVVGGKLVKHGVTIPFGQIDVEYDDVRFGRPSGHERGIPVGSFKNFVPLNVDHAPHHVSKRFFIIDD